MTTATETETTRLQRQLDFMLGWAIERAISDQPGADPVQVAEEARARFRTAAAKASDSSYYVLVGRDAL